MGPPDIVHLNIPYIIFAQAPYTIYIFSHELSCSHALHCESREGLWLQGEAAFETHSYRDAEPQSVIPLNEEKILKCLPSSHTKPKNIILTTIYMYIPSTVYQGRVVCYSKISQLGPRIITI